MATYNSAAHNSSLPMLSRFGEAGTIRVLDSGLVAVTAALTSSDVGVLFTPPRGFTVLSTFVKSSDMDTNGAPTATLNVGITGTAQLLVAASNVMQAGTAAEVVTAAGLGYQFDGATPVRWAIQAGPATGAIGSFRVWLSGFFTPTAV